MTTERFLPDPTDPLVLEAQKMIAERSEAGEREYGYPSILGRELTPLQLVEEALEEAVDQVIYLLAARRGLRGE